jgi:rod shape-determining protein MreC
MESFFGRYKNALVLILVLFIQIVILATQVKRADNPKAPNSGSTRLIRVWAVTAATPIERALVGTGHFFRNTWHNYVNLTQIRRQNQELQEQVARLKIEQVRLKEDAEQARRLQALVGFQEKFISQTVAAQVIGTSGSDLSRVIYIDKGSRAGMKTDMAVITPDGIVGKVKEVFPLSSQVLMINDRDSGAGVILEKSRLQGVLRGTVQGETIVDGVMADEKVEAGERVISSGGDRIYPKGFPVGMVTSVAPDRESGAFLAIKVKPAADLNRVEEVLVVTRMAEQAPVLAGEQGRVRAADILAQRLPSVPKTEQKPGQAGQGDAPGTSADQPKKPKTAAQTSTTTGASPNDNSGEPKKKPASGSGPAEPGKKPFTGASTATGPRVKKTGAPPDQKTTTGASPNGDSGALGKKSVTGSSTAEPGKKPLNGSSTAAKPKAKKPASPPDQLQPEATPPPGNPATENPKPVQPPPDRENPPR